MIHVPPMEPEDPIWREWRDRAEAASQALVLAVEAGAEPEIIDSLYKAQKQILLRIFNGKCAYCEVRLTGNQPGDVEHYRPKKDLTDDEFKPVFEDSNRRHRGYYWLAYNWLNLLPSCAECNRPSTSQDGKPRGKRNRFPVRNFRAFRPGEELQEEPLLLNPWIHNPEDHLRFDDEMAVLGGITPEGSKTIDILNLNREGLRESRQETHNSVKGLLVRLVTATIEGNKDLADKLARELNEYKLGAKPFSAVARVVLERALRDLARI